MANKPSRTIDEQLRLLVSRGMTVRNTAKAKEWLARISYYRLKGYRSDQDPDAWIILEVATLGELSKWYKNISHQLPAKSKIANEFGFNLHSELSSWLESIAYIRNIVAHHSRLWSRNMVKRPSVLTNPVNPWLGRPLTMVEEKRAFHLVSALLYMCDAVGSGGRLRRDVYRLLWKYRALPVHGLGFFGDWQEHPVWKVSWAKRLWWRLGLWR